MALEPASEGGASNRASPEGGAFEPGVPEKVALSNRAVPVKAALSNQASPVKVALSNQASPVKVALWNGRAGEYEAIEAGDAHQRQLI